MYPYIKVFHFFIPSYGVCVCLAIFVCALFIFNRARKACIDFNDLLILFAISLGCGMLGGNILYLLVTYDFETIYRQIVTGNFLFFKNQGTVFYGGLIGSILGAVITAKKLKMKIDVLEFCVVPYIPLGHAIGRIGCLLAGCCYGFPYHGILAVSTRFDLENRTFFPIQGIEAFLNLFVMGILLFYTKNTRKKYSVLCLYLNIYSCLRFILEFFRGDDMRGMFLSFSTSQWISLMLFLFSLILIRKNFSKNKSSEKSVPN